jgi:uncharacterized protein (TIGR02118 family)
MIKMIFLCRRRPDITHERYVELVLRGHVPLALRHHPTMRAYVVNPVMHAPAGWPELDSVAELSFDSLADYRERLYDSREGERSIQEDVAGFMGGADAYVTTEHVQKAPPRVALGERSPVVKMVCPVRRREGMTHGEFVEHWLGRHVPLALRHHPGLVGYVTNVVDARLGGEEWDGVGALYFRSLESMATEIFDSPEGERVIREDMARFIGHTGAYVCEEWVQKAVG